MSLLSVESNDLSAKLQISRSKSDSNNNEDQKESLNHLALKTTAVDDQTDVGVDRNKEIGEKLSENIEDLIKMDTVTGMSAGGTGNYLSSLSTGFNNYEKPIDIQIRRCKECNAANIVSKPSKKLKCWKCVKKSTLETHLDQTEEIKCKMCGFKTLWHSLDAHILLAHQNLNDKTVKDYEFIRMKWFKCQLCNAIPLTKDNLKKHHEINHTELPFDLENFKLFAIENKATTHVKCGYCQKCMKQTEFDSHKKFACGSNHEISNTGTISTITLNYTKPTNYYLCGGCECVIGEKNLKKHHLKRHKEMPYTENMYTLKSTIQNETCPICNKCYDLNEFESHARDVHSNLLVKGKNTKAKPSHEDPSRHCINKVTVEQKSPKDGKNIFNIAHIFSSKLFEKCDECEVEVRADNIYRHMKDVHSKPSSIGSFAKPIFKCTICGHGGFQIKSCQKHIKLHPNNPLDMSAIEVDSFYLGLKCICGLEMRLNSTKTEKHLKEHLSGAESYYIFGEHNDKVVEHKAILFKNGA